jgi:Protein of unknown function (DUF4240)
MNADEFWRIVDKVHAASKGDMKIKCDLLAAALRELSSQELQSFDEHFSNYFFRAYTWDIWGAAFIINDGCSEDSFMDFRSTLISLGRLPFEAAIVNTDSLVNFEIDPAWATFEGYQYVATKVYEEMNGKEIGRHGRDPQRVAGNRFNEWEMSSRFPKLVAKYGYKDSDWFYLKEQEDRQKKTEQMDEIVKTIMLNAGIIPSCGLIPPVRIVAKILQTGKSPKSSGRNYSWEPFDFDENYYWNAVSQLEKATPIELKST